MRIEREALIKKVGESKSDDDYLRLTRKYILHGIPYVFDDREDAYYDFRALIANHFNVNFHDVFIVGSAKLGFSLLKGTAFSADSDIDVVIISNVLFETFYQKMCDYQYSISKGQIAITEEERGNYSRFLKYIIRGWMRPDLLPLKINDEDVKKNWEFFFSTISNGKSCVGNYMVTAALFKSFYYMERYYFESLKKLIEL